MPYTLCPTVLPHWTPWGFLLFAIMAAIGFAAMIARVRKPWVGLVAFFPVFVGLLIFTMVCSGAMAFIAHH